MREIKKTRGLFEQTRSRSVKNFLSQLSDIFRLFLIASADVSFRKFSWNPLFLFVCQYCVVQQGTYLNSP